MILAGYFMENNLREVLFLFDERLKTALKEYSFENTEEIRLRTGRNAELVTTGGFIPLDIYPTADDIRSVIRRAMRYSIFANEDALKNGFITINGGHRISYSGRAVRVGEHINSMDSFGSVCVRIAREIKGCSSFLMPYITDKNGQVLSTLILSPPGKGKTTVLRDIALNISSGKNAKKTVIIDERGEIASSFLGINSLNVGERSDVLSLYDRYTGINMAIRSLSPEVIITDEIGSIEDASALREAARCGVRIIATAHSDSMESMKERKIMNEITSTNVFDRYIFIGRNKNVILPQKVYDKDLREIFL